MNSLNMASMRFLKNFPCGSELMFAKPIFNSRVNLDYHVIIRFFLLSNNHFSSYTSNYKK